MQDLPARDAAPGGNPDSSFAITHRGVDGRTCVVAVEGALDLASAPQLKRTLLELMDQGIERFVIDFSGLTHMDSMGLGVLVGFHRRLHPDAWLAITGLSERLRKLLELTGLDSRFDSYATVEEALQPPGGHSFPLNTDAAIVLGLAATAMPFATTPWAEALRWLRILRLHGEAARVLCALGVGETPMAESDPRDAAKTPGWTGRDHDDPIAGISDLSVRAARTRGAAAVGTGDLLIAVMRFYGPDFDRVLAEYGTDRDEVIERLAA